MTIRPVNLEEGLDSLYMYTPSTKEEVFMFILFSESAATEIDSVNTKFPKMSNT